MRFINSTMQIAITKEDLKDAVELWLNENSKTRLYTYNLTLHPNAIYVVRARVGSFMEEKEAHDA